MLDAADAQNPLGDWIVADTWGSPGSVAFLNSSLFEIAAVAISPDGTQFVDAGAGQFGVAVEIRSTSQAGIPEYLDSAAFMVNSVVFSPDGKTLAVGGNGLDGGVVELWTIATGVRVTSLPTSAGYVQSVAFSPDGTKLAVGGATSSATGTTSGVIEWWDAKKFTNLKTVASKTNGVTTLAYSSGGGFLFVGTEQSIQIYSTANFGQTNLYNLETTNVSSLVLAPGGATFAYGRGDGAIVVAKNPNAAADIRVHLEIVPGSVRGGTSARASITLSAPAPAGGITCRLTSNDGAVASPEVSTIQFLEGQSSANVTISTQRVRSAAGVTVRATVPGGVGSASLLVLP